MSVGGSRSGVSAVLPQLFGWRYDPAERDARGASAAVCDPHHVLSGQHPGAGAQIHPEGREHPGAV